MRFKIFRAMTILIMFFGGSIRSVDWLLKTILKEKRAVSIIGVSVRKVETALVSGTLPSNNQSTLRLKPKHHHKTL